MNDSIIVNASGYSGGVIFSNNPDAYISFTNISVENSVSQTQGGFGLIQQCRRLYLSKITKLFSSAL